MLLGAWLGISYSAFPVPFCTDYPLVIWLLLKVCLAFVLFCYNKFLFDLKHGKSQSPNLCPLHVFLPGQALSVLDFEWAMIPFAFSFCFRFNNTTTAVIRIIMMMACIPMPMPKPNIVDEQSSASKIAIQFNIFI